MSTVYIYALINPIDDQVFYIGATKNLPQRISGHVSYRYFRNDNKSKILRDIIEAGKKPEILCLDNCSGDDTAVRFLEEFYIDLFRSYGFNLPQYSKSYYCSNKKMPVYE